MKTNRTRAVSGTRSILVVLGIVVAIAAPSQAESARRTAYEKGVGGAIRLFATGSSPADRDWVSGVEAAANGVIESAERWLGMTLFDGDPYSIQIFVDLDTSDMAQSRYSFEDRSIHIDRSATADVVTHEMGHAAIHRLKPGWRGGSSLIVHEALADAWAVLATFLSDDASSRIISATGGNLRVDNEASRIVEYADGTSLRNARSDLSLDGFVVRRDTLYLCPVPGTPDDPHGASVVLTSALYDVVQLLAEHWSSPGALTVEALQSAADELGRMMLLGLFYSGEHRVTLEDYSVAFLRSARELLPATLFEPVLEAFRLRGLIGGGQNLSAEMPDVLDLTLGSEPFRSDEFLQSLEDLDDAILSLPRSSEELREAVRYLLLHRKEFQYYQCVDPDTARVVEALPVAMGDLSGTYIRVEYEYECPYPEPEEVPMEATDEYGYVPPRSINAYAGYLFDPDGALVAANVDRPL